MAARLGLTAGEAEAEAEAAAPGGEAAVPAVVVVVVPWPAAAWFRCGVACPIILRAAWSGLNVGVDELALPALPALLELELELELAFLLLSFLAEDVK